MSQLEIKKQISIFVPIAEWRAIRQEAARLRIPITELCRRIHAIEQEIAELSVVRDNLQDDQELELSLDDLTQLGFSPEHYRKNVG